MATIEKVRIGRVTHEKFKKICKSLRRSMSGQTAILVEDFVNTHEDELEDRE